MAKKSQCVWLAYDLDYEEADYKDLYKWLAEHKALECTNSAAYIPSYEYQEDICKEMAEDIRKNVKHVNRVYLIYENAERRTRGSFILGQRKDNPWKDAEK